MTIVEPDTSSLAALLREGSKAEHEAAEGSSFMGELLGGRVNARGYADYLARLRRVYETLERVGRALASDPVAGAVVDPALERLAAIDADLAFWGPGSADTPAADAYVARLELVAGDPARFVAHHYTRYLGDLSGGRAIGAIVRREFALGDGPGAAFYDFAGVPKPKPYKDAYRAALDAMDLSPERRLDVLDEVKVAFGLNGGLFDELTANLDAYRR